MVTIGSPLVPEGAHRRGPVPPTLTFARVPEGKTVKNRLHLDVNPTDASRTTRCGACSPSAPGTPTSVRAATRAGSPSPTRRATSSASCDATLTEGCP